MLQVSTETVYKKNEKGNDTNDIQGYRLIQGVEIRSNDVDKIDAISNQISQDLSRVKGKLAICEDQTNATYTCSAL